MNQPLSENISLADFFTWGAAQCDPYDAGTSVAAIMHSIAADDEKPSAVGLN